MFNVSRLRRDSFVDFWMNEWIFELTANTLYSEVVTAQTSYKSNQTDTYQLHFLNLILKGQFQ